MWPTAATAAPPSSGHCGSSVGPSGLSRATFSTVGVTLSSGHAAHEPTYTPARTTAVRIGARTGHAERLRWRTSGSGSPSVFGLRGARSFATMSAVLTHASAGLSLGASSRCSSRCSSAAAPAGSIIVASMATVETSATGMATVGSGSYGDVPSRAPEASEASEDATWVRVVFRGRRGAVGLAG